MANQANIRAVSQILDGLIMNPISQNASKNISEVYLQNVNPSIILTQPTLNSPDIKQPVCYPNNHLISHLTGQEILNEQLFLKKNPQITINPGDVCVNKFLAFLKEERILKGKYNSFEVKFRLVDLLEHLRTTKLLNDIELAGSAVTWFLSDEKSNFSYLRNVYESLGIIPINKNEKASQMNKKTLQMNKKALPMNEKASQEFEQCLKNIYKYKPNDIDIHLIATPQSIPQLRDAFVQFFCKLAKKNKEEIINAGAFTKFLFSPTFGSVAFTTSSNSGEAKFDFFITPKLNNSFIAESLKISFINALNFIKQQEEYRATGNLKILPKTVLEKGCAQPFVDLLLGILRKEKFHADNTGFIRLVSSLVNSKWITDLQLIEQFLGDIQETIDNPSTMMPTQLKKNLEEYAHNYDALWLWDFFLAHQLKKAMANHHSETPDAFVALAIQTYAALSANKRAGYGKSLWKEMRKPSPQDLQNQGLDFSKLAFKEGGIFKRIAELLDRNSQAIEAITALLELKTLMLLCTHPSQEPPQGINVNLIRSYAGCEMGQLTVDGHSMQFRIDLQETLECLSRCWELFSEEDRNALIAISNAFEISIKTTTSIGCGMVNDALQEGLIKLIESNKNECPFLLEGFLVCLLLHPPTLNTLRWVEAKFPEWLESNPKAVDSLPALTMLAVDESPFIRMQELLHQFNESIPPLLLWACALAQCGTEERGLTAYQLWEKHSSEKVPEKFLSDFVQKLALSRPDLAAKMLGKFYHSMEPEPLFDCLSRLYFSVCQSEQKKNRYQVLVLESIRNFLMEHKEIKAEDIPTDLIDRLILGALETESYDLLISQTTKLPLKQAWIARIRKLIAEGDQENAEKLFSIFVKKWWQESPLELQKELITIVCTTLVKKQIIYLEILSQKEVDFEFHSELVDAMKVYIGSFASGEPFSTQKKIWGLLISPLFVDFINKKPVQASALMEPLFQNAFGSQFLHHEEIKKDVSNLFPKDQEPNLHAILIAFHLGLKVKDFHKEYLDNEKVLTVLKEAGLEKELGFLWQEINEQGEKTTLLQFAIDFLKKVPPKEHASKTAGSLLLNAVNTMIKQEDAQHVVTLVEKLPSFFPILDVTESKIRKEILFTCFSAFSKWILTKDCSAEDSEKLFNLRQSIFKRYAHQFGQGNWKHVDHALFKALEASPHLSARLKLLEMTLAMKNLTDIADAISLLLNEILSDEEQAKFTFCVESFLDKIRLCEILNEKIVDTVFKLMESPKFQNQQGQFLAALVNIHKKGIKADLALSKALSLISKCPVADPTTYYWSKTISEYHKIAPSFISLLSEVHPKLIEVLNPKQDSFLFLKLAIQFEKMNVRYNLSRKTAETYCLFFNTLAQAELKKETFDRLIDLLIAVSTKLEKAPPAIRKEVFFFIMNKLVEQHNQRAKEFLHCFLSAMRDEEWKNPLQQNAGKKWIEHWLKNGFDFNVKESNFYKNFFTLCLKANIPETIWKEILSQFILKFIDSTSAKYEDLNSPSWGFVPQVKLTEEEKNWRTLLAQHILEIFPKVLEKAKADHKLLNYASFSTLILRIAVNCSLPSLLMVLSHSKTLMACFTHPKVGIEKGIDLFQFILAGFILSYKPEDSPFEEIHFKKFHELCKEMQNKKGNQSMPWKGQFFKFCRLFSCLVHRDEAVCQEAFKKLLNFFNKTENHDGEWIDRYSIFLMHLFPHISEKRREGLIEIIIEGFIPKCLEVPFEDKDTKLFLPTSGLISQIFHHCFTLDLAVGFIRKLRGYPLENRITKVLIATLILEIQIRLRNVKNNEPPLTIDFKEEAGQQFADELGKYIQALIQSGIHIKNNEINHLLVDLSKIYPKDKMQKFLEECVEIQLKLESPRDYHDSKKVFLDKRDSALMLAYVIVFMKDNEEFTRFWLEKLYDKLMEAIDILTLMGLDIARDLISKKPIKKHIHKTNLFNLDSLFEMEEQLLKCIPLKVLFHYKLNAIKKVLKKNPSPPPPYALFERILAQLTKLVEEAPPGDTEVSNLISEMIDFPFPDNWFLHKKEMEKKVNALNELVSRRKLRPKSADFHHPYDFIKPDINKAFVIELMESDIKTWLESSCAACIFKAADIIDFSKPYLDEKQALLINVCKEYPGKFFKFCRKLFEAVMNSNSAFGIKQKLIRGVVSSICKSVELLQKPAENEAPDELILWRTHLANTIEAVCLDLINVLKVDDGPLLEVCCHLYEFLSVALNNHAFNGQNSSLFYIINKLYPFVKSCNSNKLTLKFDQLLKSLGCTVTEQNSATVIKLIESDMMTLLKSPCAISIIKAADIIDFSNPELHEKKIPIRDACKAYPERFFELSRKLFEAVFNLNSPFDIKRKIINDTLTSICNSTKVLQNSDKLIPNSNRLANVIETVCLAKIKTLKTDDAQFEQLCAHLCEFLSVAVGNHAFQGQFQTFFKIVNELLTFAKSHNNPMLLSKIVVLLEPFPEYAQVLQIDEKSTILNG